MPPLPQRLGISRRCVTITNQHGLLADISGPVRSINAKVLAREDNYAEKSTGVWYSHHQRQRIVQSVQPMSKPTNQQKACVRMCVLCGVYNQGHLRGAKWSEWNKARSNKLLRVLSSKGVTDADTSDRLSSCENDKSSFIRPVVRELSFFGLRCVWIVTELQSENQVDGTMACQHTRIEQRWRMDMIYMERRCLFVGLAVSRCSQVRDLLLDCGTKRDECSTERHNLGKGRCKGFCK